MLEVEPVERFLRAEGNEATTNKGSGRQWYPPYVKTMTAKELDTVKYQSFQLGIFRPRSVGGKKAKRPKSILGGVTGRNSSKA